ncbi:MAG TPA: sugar kinase [Candidatus Limnocylindrales bacterium]
MSVLEIPSSADTRWDCVALGEVMLRLDPGEDRISRARTFRAYEGGGEYNVARGLSRCFGLRTAIVTALVDNPIGHLIEDLVMTGGVDRSHMIWRPFDGVGQASRNGLNFTERGFGIRSALGCSDRGHSAVSQLRTGEIDWETIFGAERARWFHTGGIFAALSETTPAVALEAMQAARRNGAIVSYDLNYRPSLWQATGGKARAQAVNRQLVEQVDVLLGNEEDFTAALGFGVEGVDESLSSLDAVSYARMVERVVAAYPNLRAVATTLRTVHSATRNDWGAILWAGGQTYQAQTRLDLEILDRVGGGDSFASGLAYAFLSGLPPSDAIEWGAAHGALAMTTPGDASMAGRDEVERLVRGGSARVIR